MLDKVLDIPQVLNIPGFSICQGYTRFLKKCCTKDAWQDFEHSWGSEYDTVLNMSGLHEVLAKALRYTDIWKGPEYASSS